MVDDGKATEEPTSSVKSDHLLDLRLGINE
jgi:hypothetical protein